MDEMYSTANSTLHQCASSCFGVQKSVPKPKKLWTSQQTAAMSVWTGLARHQLLSYRNILKRADKKCVLLAWRNLIGQIDVDRIRKATRERFSHRGAEACVLLTMRIQRTAMKRAITRDLQAWLEKLVSDANDAAAKRRHEPSVCRHEETEVGTRQTAQSHQRREWSLAGGRKWRRHWAELLHGQETKWSELGNVASAHAKQHTGSRRMNLITLHDVTSALAKRNPRKATGPSGIPISVWQAGGESSARILLALLNTTRVPGRSAVGMRGGRAQELYKNRGESKRDKII